jgi:hypothetical protein
MNHKCTYKYHIVTFMKDSDASRLMSGICIIYETVCWTINMLFNNVA